MLILDSITQALLLIARADSGLMGIVAVSVQVSGLAVLLGAALGLPFGAWLAVVAFPGRGAVVVVLNGLMGLPTVLVGVIVYLLLSRAGPLGHFGLLFTPGAMVVAQTILVAPLIAAITRQTVASAWTGQQEAFASMRVRAFSSVGWLLADCRYALVVVVLAGFGRALSEVGAVMIVGGNINGATRTMTTAISLETSKGDLPLALALGLVLMTIVLGLNAATSLVRAWAEKRVGR